MKILFLVESLARGGKERQLVEIIQNVSNLHEIYLIIYSDKIEFSGVENYTNNIYIVSKATKLKNFSSISILKLVNKIKPHIIHSWDHLSTVYCILPSVLFGIPIINGGIRYASPIKKKKIWLISKIGFFFSKAIIANSYAGLRAHNLTNNKYKAVIYNGFDFSRIPKTNIAAIKKELNINQKFIVGMVANFLPSKDQFTLIKASEKLLEDNYDVGVVFIGDGPTLSKVRSLISPKYKSCFHFLGKRTDVERIVQIFDVGVQLSNSKGHAEGISNSILEIMASKIPVIATKGGGTNEIINNGVNGFLISSFDNSELISKLHYLMIEENKKLIGHNGYKTIIQKFSNKTMLCNYMKLYDELVKLNNENIFYRRYKSK